MYKIRVDYAFFLVVWSKYKNYKGGEYKILRPVSRKTSRVLSTRILRALTTRICRMVSRRILMVVREYKKSEGGECKYSGSGE